MARRKRTKKKLPRIKTCVRCGGGRFEQTTRDNRYRVAGVTFTVPVPMARCVACGEGYLDGPDLSGAELRVAARLARSGIITAETFRFMRRALRLTAVELADLLQVREESISRWEHGKREVDRSAWVLLAGMVLDRVAGASTTLGRLRELRAPKRLPKSVRLDMDAPL